MTPRNRGHIVIICPDGSFDERASFLYQQISKLVEAQNDFECTVLRYRQTPTATARSGMTADNKGELANAPRIAASLPWIERMKQPPVGRPNPASRR